MGDGKYRPPNLQIIFTGSYKHKSNKITPGWDCSTCERAKPEPYCKIAFKRPMSLKYFCLGSPIDSSLLLLLCQQWWKSVWKCLSVSLSMSDTSFRFNQFGDAKRQMRPSSFVTRTHRKITVSLLWNSLVIDIWIQFVIDVIANGVILIVVQTPESDFMSFGVVHVDWHSFWRSLLRKICRYRSLIMIYDGDNTNENSSKTKIITTTTVAAAETAATTATRL